MRSACLLVQSRDNLQAGLLPDCAGSRSFFPGAKSAGGWRTPDIEEFIGLLATRRPNSRSRDLNGNADMVKIDCERARAHPIHILLVDDEEGFTSILAKRLAKRNFVVTSTQSGAEAIQAIRKQDFDVAVLDLKMPDMDGMEVLKVFRNMVPQMSVIMLTGHGSDQAARNGLESGAYEYLTKPCDLEDLVIKIMDACKREESK